MSPAAAQLLMSPETPATIYDLHFWPVPYEYRILRTIYTEAVVFSNLQSPPPYVGFSILYITIYL